jgi:SSS family solute:Na+ symporter
VTAVRLSDAVPAVPAVPGQPDRAALVAFALVLGAASLVTLVAYRRPVWRRPVAPGEELVEWALLGRRLGAVRTWFLLGGSIFTAYTFVAVPALVYGVGGLGFFAVPYTIVVFQLGFVVLPWLWRHARIHGWVTPADVARSRFDSPTLALAVAVTGLLATMPYVALQLLGLSAALTVMGIPADSAVADLAMAATFTVLAVGTFRHGLGAPAAVAVVKGVLAFGATALLVVLVLRATDGAANLFEAAGTSLAATPSGQGSLLLPDGLGSAYASLAIGSALALVLYPHVLTPTFAARSADVVRRVCVGLLAWTALLGVLALGGLAARAEGIRVPPGHAELALPGLVRELLPSGASGVVLGAFGIGALVPAAVMSVAAATTFANNVYLEYVNPTALPEQVARVARWVSVLVKVGALAFVVGLRAQDAITLQLLGGVWILQTLPAVVLGLLLRRPHRYALLAGLVTGVVTGTWLVAAQGFVAVTRFDVGPASVGIYAGLVALALNLAVAAVLTPVLDRLGVARGLDTTGTGIGGKIPSEWEVGT